MTTDKNNSIIKISSNELVQHKNKFKSIAIYNEEIYQSEAIELINTDNEGLGTLVLKAEATGDKKGLVLSPDWINGNAQTNVVYTWKALAPDGYTDLIKNEDKNISLDNEQNKLTILDQTLLTSAITVTVVAYKQNIFVAQSTPYIVFERGIAPAIAIDEEKNQWIINGEPTGIPVTGAPGSTPVITIVNGYWVIDGVETTQKAQGETGKDGSDIEYVYYRSKTEKSSLTAPTESDIQSQPSSVDDTMGDKWYPSPLGITDIWKYEYVSIRTKPAGINTNWTPFSAPVIWSKWGDKGQDGDGVSYEYYLKNDETPPAYNASDANWTDEPTGVSKDNKYEYVVQIKTTTGGDGKAKVEVSDAALWAKWSEDGNNGATPYIGEDDYWYINGVSLGIKAKGEDGEDGTTPTVSINNDGYWVINGTTTDVSAQATNYTNLLLRASSQTFIKNPNNNNVITPSNITLTAHLYGDLVGKENKIVWKKNGATIPNATGTSYIVNNDVFDDITSVEYSASIDDYDDEFTIYLLTEGLNGTNGTPGGKGDPGDNAISAFLTDASISFSADKDGYVAAGVQKTTTVKVFNGATEVSGVKITAVTTQNGFGYDYTTDTDTLKITTSKSQLGSSDSTSGQITITAQATINNVVKTFTLGLSWDKTNTGAPGNDGYTPVKNKDYFDGADGTSIVWKGNFDSAPSNPENGWAYYNIQSKASYVYQSGSWYQMSIDGVDGQDGDDGISIVWKGESSSAPSNPQINWVYKDTDDGKVYIYNGNAWELMVLDGSDGQDGTDGTDGLSVFITYNDSTTDPGTPTGNGTANGWHTNATSTAIWMSQKIAENANSGTWGAPIKIKGETGPQGNDGLGVKPVNTRIRTQPLSWWREHSLLSNADKNWTTDAGQGYVNTHLNIGDTAYISGIATYGNGLTMNVVLYGKVESVTEATDTVSGVVILASLYLIEGGEKGEQGNDGETIYLLPSTTSITKTGGDYSPSSITLDMMKKSGDNAPESIGITGFKYTLSIDGAAESATKIDLVSKLDISSLSKKPSQSIVISIYDANGKKVDVKTISINVETLSEYVLYSNYTAGDPPLPSGSYANYKDKDNTATWVKVQASDSVWQSKKSAYPSLEANTSWGAPVRISGVLTNFTDLYNTLQEQADDNYDGLYKWEDTIDGVTHKRIGVDASVIRAGAIKIGTSGIKENNKFYADMSNESVYIAGWTVNSDSISKDRVELYTGDEKVQKSKVTAGDSPIRISAGETKGEIAQEATCILNDQIYEMVAPGDEYVFTLKGTLPFEIVAGEPSFTQVGEIQMDCFSSLTGVHNILSEVLDMQDYNGDENFYVSSKTFTYDLTKKEFYLNITIPLDTRPYFQYFSTLSATVLVHAESNVPCFMVLEDGSLYAQAADITGTIAAKEGSVGGWEINEDGISKNNVLLSTNGEEIASLIKNEKSKIAFAAGDNAISTSELEYFIYDDSSTNGEKNVLCSIDYSNAEITIQYELSTDIKLKSVNFVQGSVKLYLEYASAGTYEKNAVLKTIDYTNNNVVIIVMGIEDRTSLVDWEFARVSGYFTYDYEQPYKKFTVLEDGSSYLSGAKIEGELISTKGAIGDLTISNGGLFYKNNYALDSTGLTLNQNSKIQLGGLSMSPNGRTGAIFDASGSLQIKGANGAALILDSAEGSLTTFSFDLIGEKINNNTKMKFYLKEHKAQKIYFPVTFIINYWQAAMLGDGDIQTFTFTINANSTVSNSVSIPTPSRLKIQTNGELQGLAYWEHFDTYKTTMESLVIEGTDFENPPLQFQQRNPNKTYNLQITGNLIPSIKGVANSSNPSLASDKNGYDIGNGEKPWRNIFAATTTIQSSDKNLKNNIQSIGIEYEKIFDTLQPVSYKFNVNDSNRTHIGLIAQDVKESVENAGLTTQDFAGYCEWENEDGSIGCGLRYGEFIALNINEIQKLKKRAKQAEETIELQDAYIKKLEERIEKLEQRLL